MALLRDLTSPTPGGTTADAGPLRDLISAAVNADGTVDHVEHVSAEALFEAIPQLRGAPAAERPPVASRKALLASFAKISDDKLCRQLFVLAVDLVLASEGATEREDTFIGELTAALRIPDAFARQVITVMACKYARER